MIIVQDEIEHAGLTHNSWNNILESVSDAMMKPLYLSLTSPLSPTLSREPNSGSLTICPLVI